LDGVFLLGLAALVLVTFGLIAGCAKLERRK